MPRIRTIKPEFWSNERLSELPEPTHMLAGALINYADDEGYFNANPTLVKAACFPLRDPTVDILTSLEQLATIDYLRLCDGSDGRRYGWIVGFEKHQRVNRPTASKVAGLAKFNEDSVRAHGGLSEGSLTEREREREWETELGNGTGTSVAVHCMNTHGAFEGLTKNDLRDTAKLLDWYAEQAARPNPIVTHSDAGRLLVFAAAEQALAGKKVRNAVAVFSAIISDPVKFRVTSESDDKGRRRLADFDRQSSRPSEYAAGVADSLGLGGN